MKISAVLSLTTVFSLNQNGSCTFLRSTKENNDVSVPDSLERKLGVQCCYAGTCINPGELLKGYICLNNGNWGTSPKKCCKNNKCVSPREYHIGPTETCQCSKWGGNWGNNGGFKNCKPNNSWEWGRTQSVKYHQNYQSFCRRDELHDKGRVDEQYELIFMDTFNICKERCDSMVSCTGFEYKKIDKYEKNCKIWFEVVHRFNTAPDRGRHATCFWKING